MQARGVVPARVAAALALAACGDGQRAGGARNDTAVLGSSGPQGSRAGAAPPLTDGAGRPIPPPTTTGRALQMTRSADDAALAVWIQDGDVLAAAWTPAAGWSAPQPLERIHGDSSDPQIVSNGKGQAMTVWHHAVGNIHSLRFSRFDAATGWSVPDVMPGAMPRPAAAGAPPGQDAPRLEMDEAGNVAARWPSGFHANEMQVARFTLGQGWSEASNERIAAAAAPAASGPR